MRDFIKEINIVLFGQLELLFPLFTIRCIFLFIYLFILFFFRKKEKPRAPPTSFLFSYLTLLKFTSVEPRGREAEIRKNKELLKPTPKMSWEFWEFLSSEIKI